MMEKRDHISKEDCDNIQNEVIAVLKKHDLPSGLARLVLNKTIDYVDNYSRI